MTNLSASGAFLIFEPAAALHVALSATAQANLLVALVLGLAFALALAAALAGALADVRQVTCLAAASALCILEAAVALTWPSLPQQRQGLSVCIETAPISIGVGSAPLAYIVDR